MKKCSNFITPGSAFERFNFLRETRLLDSLPNEEEYRRLANLAARIFNVSPSLFSQLMVGCLLIILDTFCIHLLLLFP
jgi:hypothetical protein